MVLTRNVLVKPERQREAARALLGTAWPGNDRVPANPRITCRKVEPVQVLNAYVILLAVYEG